MMTNRHTVARFAVTGTVLVLLTVLIIFPMVFLFLASVSDGVPRPGSILSNGLTLDNYAILSSQLTMRALGVSASTSLVACALAIAIGGALAFLCARTDIPGRRLIYFAAIAPLLIPSYVGAFAWAILGAPGSGLINILLRDLSIPFQISVYGANGMIFVLTLFYAPYAFLLIHSSASLMDPDLEQAANVHGGSTSQMMREVTLPLLLPAILGAAMLIFILAIENFAIAYIIGSPMNIDTLPTVIYRLMLAYPSRANEAAAIAVLLTSFLVLLTLLQRKLLSRRSYTTVAGKGVRPSRIALGRWRWVFILLPIVYVLLGNILPLIGLTVVTFQRSPFLASIWDLFQPGAMTMRALNEVLASAQVRLAAINTGMVSVSAAFMGTLLCFTISYMVNRTRLPGRASFEYIAMAPLAVPAIVFGMGLLWTWLVLPVPVYGTIAVLIIAFLANQMPQGYRTVSASIMQIDRDLEDSAVMAGASRVRAVSYVTAPLMKSGLIATFVLLLILSIRELTVPLFLFTSNTRLLSIVIFDDIDNGFVQRAAAIAILYTLVIAALAILSQVIQSRNK